MVEVETVDGSSLNMCGVVETCEAGGSAAPFCDGIVQERLAAELGNDGGKLLGRGCSLQDNPHLFGNYLAFRFQRAHHAVAAIDMERQMVVFFRYLIPQHSLNGLLDIGPHLCQPAIELPEQEGVAYPADDDSLIAHEFRAFQLDRV